MRLRQKTSCCIGIRLALSSSATIEEQLNDRACSIQASIKPDLKRNETQDNAWRRAAPDPRGLALSFRCEGGFTVVISILDRPLQGVALTRSPSPRHFEFPA